jgi:hypothetical protein
MIDEMNWNKRIVLNKAFPEPGCEVERTVEQDFTTYSVLWVERTTL